MRVSDSVSFMFTFAGFSGDYDTRAAGNSGKNRTKSGRLRSENLLRRNQFPHSRDEAADFCSFSLQLSTRMGLPVDGPDGDEDAHKYEQQAAAEGEEGESQTEAVTPPAINKKRRKNKKR
ncbi:hypothetical protein PAMP_009983 [Pampus punctatissimus]